MLVKKIEFEDMNTRNLKMCERLSNKISSGQSLTKDDVEFFNLHNNEYFTYLSWCDHIKIK